MGKSVNFNWSELDRNTLFDLLYSMSDRIVNRKLTVDQLHAKLVFQIKKFIPIRFKKNFNPKVENGWVFVGGAYYSSYDENFEKSIEINFNYNPANKTIILTPRKFTRLCIGFADTILHEIIHMRQHRRRNWIALPDFPSTASRTKQREEQEYLGCRDEIDAYAFNIACELTDKFNSKQTKIIRHLNEDQKGCYQRHNTYSMYLKVFGHDHNHVVIKELKKKIVGYLPQANVGKPYRTSDWICY